MGDFLFQNNQKQYQKMLVKGKTAFMLAHPDDETIVGLGYMARLGILAQFKVVDHKMP